MTTSVCPNDTRRLDRVERFLLTYECPQAVGGPKGTCLGEDGPRLPLPGVVPRGNQGPVDEEVGLGEERVLMRT